MSTVFVHVGQCGNQIGSTFWEKAWSSKIPSSPFFDEVFILSFELLYFVGFNHQLPSYVDPSVWESSMHPDRFRAKSYIINFEKFSSSRCGYLSPSKCCFGSAVWTREQLGFWIPWRSFIRRYFFLLTIHLKNIYCDFLLSGSDGSLSAKALEALRREVERIDAFTGVVLAHCMHFEK